MNLVELQRALRQLRCSGMAAGLETRLLLHHAYVLTCGPKSWRTRLQGERHDT